VIRPALLRYDDEIRSVEGQRGCTESALIWQ